MLEIKDLHVSIKDKEIVKGVSLSVKPGEVVAIMGLNGSGKSTLASAVMGSPMYTIDSGSVLMDGKDITNTEADERARTGLFLLFQHPPAIPGVNIISFVKAAKNALGKEGTSDASAVEGNAFSHELDTALGSLRMSPAMAERQLNQGFSGGEKKRSEMLQLALLQPTIAILDEPDSGLDVDGVRAVAAVINEQRKKGMGFLLITHYQRILDHVKPDKVHVMVQGRIVKSGDASLALKIEQEGYDWLGGNADTTKGSA